MRRSFSVLFLLYCLGLILPGMAYAGINDYLDGCPSELPNAKIKVVIQMFDPPVYQNYSVAQLSTMPSRTSPYPSDAVTHTYGLTRNPLEFLVESHIGISTNKMTHKSCYWYDDITVTLRVKPEIFMGNEIKQGSCYFNAVLKHELEHANIERRLLQDYQPIITQTVTDLVRKIGFIRNIDEGHGQDVYNHLQATMTQQIDVIHAHMDPVRSARQAQIDTVASYEATAAACRNVEPAPY